jgi:hypothetical protein
MIETRIKFLEWAWSQWKDYRPWLSVNKEISLPASDTARDDTRLLFRLKKDSAFLIGVRGEVKTVRVGMVTTNRWVSESIEQAVLDSGGSMTEFLEDEMEADDDLEFPMLHYHDSGEFYFLSEIPFEILDSPELYDRVALYLKGYVIALEGRLEEE